MAPEPARDAIADRVRRALASHDPREVVMFGSLAFIIDGSISVAARKGGALLVRIDPRRRTELLERPGVGPAYIGPSRMMEANWIEVAGDVLADDEALGQWLQIALWRQRD